METIRFRHAHFTARFPVDCRYSPAHCWMRPVPADDPGGDRIWRVGFTKFATRMLGELVEMTLSVAPGQAVRPGDRIGTVEGFKAVSDLFSVIDGTFRVANPAIASEACLTHSDPYGEGWLYEAHGQPEPGDLDVHGYIALLTETIDRLQASRYSDHGPENPDGEPLPEAVPEGMPEEESDP
jgi:glycine cleavage system H protein